MDKICVSGMMFYGYHGVYSEENKLGQRFKADVILKLDLRVAGKCDDLDKTVDYGNVYNVVKQIIEGPPKKLIEAVAEDIADQLLKTFSRVQECVVKVIKPEPPIAGHFDSIAVELTRSREQ